MRGFGKLWRANQALRNQLGWATASEQTDRGASAPFCRAEGLSWLVGRSASNTVYILRAGQPATAREVGWAR